MNKPKKKMSLRKFWRSNWVEVLAVSALILGFLLLKFERSWIVRVKDSMVSWLSLLKNVLSGLDTYNLAGGLVILAGVALVLWRIRYRLENASRWHEHTCPRCGSSLHRIHRNTLDRMIGFLMLPHSRRFRCDNLECGWSGLRYGRHQAGFHEEDFPVSPGPAPRT